jgi:hypothetical protein
MFPIVPRSKAHGVDFCGEDYLFYGTDIRNQLSRDVKY